MSKGKSQANKRQRQNSWQAGHQRAIAAGRFKVKPKPVEPVTRESLEKMIKEGEARERRQNADLFGFDNALPTALSLIALAEAKGKKK